MDATFAEMVDSAAGAAGLNDYQLSAAIGLLPGHKVFSAKQVGRLRRGEQRTVPAAVLWRLVDVLELDPVRAWKAALEAADMLPPQLTAEQFEELRTLISPPLEPALAQAVGGSDTPPARSLRSTEDSSYPGKDTTATLTVLAAWRPDSKSARISQEAA